MRSFLSFSQQAVLFIISFIHIIIMQERRKSERVSHSQGAELIDASSSLVSSSRPTKGMGRRKQKEPAGSLESGGSWEAMENGRIQEIQTRGRAGAGTRIAEDRPKHTENHVGGGGGGEGIGYIPRVSSSTSTYPIQLRQSASQATSDDFRAASFEENNSATQLRQSLDTMMQEEKQNRSQLTPSQLAERVAERVQARARQHRPDQDRISPLPSQSNSSMSSQPTGVMEAITSSWGYMQQRNDSSTTGNSTTTTTASSTSKQESKFQHQTNQQQQQQRGAQHALGNDPILAARSTDLGEAMSPYFRVRDDKMTDPNNSLGNYSNSIRDDSDMTSKIPANTGLAGITQRLWNCVRFNTLILLAVLAAMVLVVMTGVYVNRHGKLSDMVDLATIDWDVDINIGFIGNSYFFVNDIPRLMEAISGGHIYQDSVIHSSAGSLPALLMRGNGMYYAWQTDNAMLTTTATTQYYYKENNNQDGNENDDQKDGGEDAVLYDFGLCTVAQILMGNDEILSFGNNDNAYINDNKNPCIVDEDYYDYVTNKLASSTVSMANKWDYIVLVDQTKRMVVDDARTESIYSLKYGYGPLLKETGAIPVLVDTHAFWSDQTNMTGLGGDVEHFQSLIHSGVYDYANALAQVLPESQAPLIAPIGVAYMTVYQESKSKWEKLFMDDQMHASLHGSYLFATVLYATLFGHLPNQTLTVHDELMESLFATSRRLLLSSSSSSTYTTTTSSSDDGDDYNDDSSSNSNDDYNNMNNYNNNDNSLLYPTASEAQYYRGVARRVTLQGYLPDSLKQSE